MKINLKNKELNKETSFSRKQDNGLWVYKEFTHVPSLGLGF